MVKDHQNIGKGSSNMAGIEERLCLEKLSLFLSTYEWLLDSYIIVS